MNFLNSGFIALWIHSNTICLFEYSGDREVFGNITYWYIHKNKCWVYAYWHWLNLQWCLSQLHPFIIITLILWHLETSWSTSTTRTWPKSKATRSTIMSVCIFSTLIFFSVPCSDWTYGPLLFRESLLGALNKLEKSKQMKFKQMN